MGHGEIGPFRSGPRSEVGRIRGIPALHESGHVHLAGSCDTPFPADFILQRRLISCLDIEIADTAVVCGSYRKSHHIGADSGDVPAACYAVTEPSGVLVDQELAGNPVRIILRPRQGPELCEVPVAAPDGVRIVVAVERLPVRAQRDLPHSAVVLRVGAVHIAGEPASEQRVEKSCIEFHTVLLQSSLYTDAPEGFFPVMAGLRMSLVEVKARSLRLHVQTRVFNRRIGKAYLHIDIVFLPGVKGEVHPCSCPAADRLSRELLRPCECPVRDRLRIEHSAEIHGHGSAFLVDIDIRRLGDHPAFHTAVTVGHMRVLDTAAFTHARTDVEDKVGLLGSRERITVEPDTLCGSQFRLHTVIFQQHGIISRVRHLVFLVEAGTVAA